MAAIAMTATPAFASDAAPAKASPTVAQASATPAPDVQAEIADLKARLLLLEQQQAQSAQNALADRERQAAEKDAAAKKPAQNVVHVGTANTDIRLYALLEATIGNQSNSTATGAAAYGLPVSWFSGNRWGIDASQKLSKDPNGLSFIAKLESEYELPSGDMDTPGVLFNRDAWVGIQGKNFGKLTIGRQNTLPRDVVNIWGDPYIGSSLTTGEGGFTNVNNFKQIIYYASGGNGAGGQGDTRYDQGIVYKKLFDNGFYVGLGYNFGDMNGPGGPNGSGPIPGGGFNRGSTAAAGVGYNGKIAHVSGFYNTTNVLSPATIGGTNFGVQDQSWALGGNLDWGKNRLDAGYMYYTGDQGSLGRRYDNVWTVSGKHAPNKFIDYELGLQEFYVKNAGVNGAGFVLRPYVNALGAAGTVNGTRFTAYGSVITHPVSNLDVYIAGDDLLSGQGYLDSRAHGSKHELEIVTGTRYRF
ncbi:MAG TPA: porin [Candidatus Elarobacter sp.]|jgi:predicted porin